MIFITIKVPKKMFCEVRGVPFWSISWPKYQIDFYRNQICEP